MLSRPSVFVLCLATLRHSYSLETRSVRVRKIRESAGLRRRSQCQQSHSLGRPIVERHSPLIVNSALGLIHSVSFTSILSSRPQLHFSFSISSINIFTSSSSPPTSAPPPPTSLQIRLYYSTDGSQLLLEHGLQQLYHCTLRRTTISQSSFELEQHRYQYSLKILRQFPAQSLPALQQRRPSQPSASTDYRSQQDASHDTHRTTASGHGASRYVCFSESLKSSVKQLIQFVPTSLCHRQSQNLTTYRFDLVDLAFNLTSLTNSFT